MGEHEVGSLLHVIIAVFVFGIIVTFFATAVFALIKLSGDVHTSAYEVD